MGASIALLVLLICTAHKSLQDLKEPASSCREKHGEPCPSADEHESADRGGNLLSSSKLDSVTDHLLAPRERLEDTVKLTVLDEDSVDRSLEKQIDSGSPETNGGHDIQNTTNVAHLLDDITTQGVELESVSSNNEGTTTDSSDGTVLCSKLLAVDLNCSLSYSCVYGKPTTVACRPKDGVKCQGPQQIARTFSCRFCYQTEQWEHQCSGTASCKVITAPRQYYRANCTVNADVLCLGWRNFLKNLPCNWTGGYRWTTALALSITLGGFGVDRFYLGHWQEGIGKLFSFGGLGVWTLIDVILISIRYLGPADGSLYIW